MKSQLLIKTQQQLENQYLNGYAFPDLFDLLIDTQLQIDEMCEPSQLLQSATHTKKVKGCRCSKTKCGNGYCECFSGHSFCSSECECLGCVNTELLSKESQPTVSIAESLPNKKKKSNKQPGDRKKGCSCKRSACDKRYCECYRKGAECDRSCSCVGCLNGLTLEKVG